MRSGDVPLWLRRGVDGVAYAVAVAAVAFAAGAAVSFALGWGWQGVKYWLFLVGWLGFGVGTFKLRPRAAWKGSDGDGHDDDQGVAETRFARATRTAVPDGLAVDEDERWSAGARLFLGSVAVLVASMAMEFVFGVGA